MDHSHKHHSFHHAKLGNIKGHLNTLSTEYFTRGEDAKHVNHDIDVVHFRSIPYATIQERFKPCERLEGLPDSFDNRPKGDFTQYGYSCPQPPHTPDQDAFLGGPLPESEHINRFDEFRCLTLSISVPGPVLQQQKSKPSKHPVLVYIHGGGYVEGGGATFPQADACRLAALSYHDGNPVILVNINYRLGLFGFMSCSDLFSEQKQTLQHEKPLGVVGLDDQRQAFRWVHDHIAGFGGDPFNITVFGESAGGGAVANLCCTKDPLFKRAIIQSSSGASKPPAELEWYDRYYFRLLGLCGIEHKGSQALEDDETGLAARKRLDALRKVPVKDLVRSMRKLHPWILMPYVAPWESDLDLNYTTEAQLLHSNTWLESLMIGDTLFEGTFAANAFDHTTVETIQHLYYRAFGKELSDRILDAYGIRPGMSPYVMRANMMTLYGDFGICQTQHHVIESLLALQTSSHSRDNPRLHQATASPVTSKKLYRYNLALPLPFPTFPFSYIPGPHGSDVALLFLNLLDRIPRFRNDFYSRQAVGMARRWIAYAHGKDPWPQYKAGYGEKKIAILDQVDGWVVRSREEDEKHSGSGDGADLWGGRRYKQWEIIDEVMEAVLNRGGEEKDGKMAGLRRLQRGRQIVQDLPTYMRPPLRSKV